ncbi:MAG: hypothetical protein AB7G87_12725 [Clostridia bacterium]
MPQRKNMRLKDYDYSQVGYYFVTICTYGRQYLFGKIVDGAMIRGFKASVTTKINILRNTQQCPAWQSKYHDHIIRNKQNYLKVWEYISTNPLRWQDDKYFV